MMTINIEASRPSNNTRKAGINRNKQGSVRKVNNSVYVDFYYLDDRIRVPSGLPWNQENAKKVREQLDKIIMRIANGTFTFAEVFPKSKKAAYFTQKESMTPGRDRPPCTVFFKEYALEWYQLYKESGRVTGRTLLGYNSLITQYLIPFFGERSFEDLNAAVLDEFVSWARRLQLRGKPASNRTINKSMVPLRMICKHAAVRFNWGAGYDPFFGFKKLRVDDRTTKVNPFSVNEQEEIISVLPSHWKPYFKFAFYSGLRQGEQLSLKPEDIDWSENKILVKRAMTLDEQGHRVEGKTKNKYSRREIPLLSIMQTVLREQLTICENLESKYLFCTTTGEQPNHANLSTRVWRPALQKAGIQYRPMIQTRHSFATTALSLGENPLWIAHIMGHRDTDMIIKVYTKYLKNGVGKNDGMALNATYLNMIGKDN